MTLELFLAGMEAKLIICVYIANYLNFASPNINIKMQSDSPFEQPASQINPQQHLIMDAFDHQMAEGKKAIDSINSLSQQNKLMCNQKPQNMPIIPEVMRNNIHNQMHNQNEQHSSDIDRNESQLISNSKLDDLDLQRTKKPSKLLIGCNCLKSKCSKNYCQCFTQGRKCSQLCKCMDCENNSENENRYRAPMEMEEGERACFCKKSNCLKKYCECYNYGAKCTKNCRCEQCRNTLEDCREPELGNAEMEEIKRSGQQIEDINSKIDEIASISPQQTRDYILSFLEYWLS